MFILFLPVHLIPWDLTTLYSTQHQNAVTHLPLTTFFSAGRRDASRAADMVVLCSYFSLQHCGVLTSKGDMSDM